MADQKIITRAEFISQLKESCGLRYVDAAKMYDAMVRIVENGVLRGERINFGKVGALVPHWTAPRTVAKGFDKLPGGRIRRTKKLFHLDGRVRYRFRMYRAFLRSHELQWFRS